MCGIVGAIAQEPVALMLLEALQRLEYRGYDSAGIATITDGRIDRRRAEGKLAQLATLLEAHPLGGDVGIGHTRWATHGAPTETNAHPHLASGVAVVHNGIIENFAALRHELEEAGHDFQTQTDTEVVPHLVARNLALGLDIEEAARQAIGRLEGAFGLVLLFQDAPDLLIAARRGSPLAIGYGEAHGAMYVGSDALALAPLTDRIQYLDENDIAFIRVGDVRIEDASGQIASRPIKQTALSGALIGKGNHRHFMEKEIFEQPAVLGDTLRSFAALADAPTDHRIALADLPFEPETLTRLTTIACGTAFYACMVAKYWFEKLAKLPVECDIASEFRYREPPMDAGTAGLFVSQSGETADTLAALRYIKSLQRPTLAVVNVPESSLAREADGALRTLAGPEIGVASTKAFTTQLATLACLALGCAKARGFLPPAEEARLVKALDEVPALMLEVLEQDGVDPPHRRWDHGGARRALYRSRADVSDRPGRCLEAQGDQLHPRRGLCCGRAQARADRADRRHRAGRGRGADRCALREDGEQSAGGGGAWRPDHLAERSNWRRRLGQVCGAQLRHAGGRPVRGAAALHRAGAASGLSHRNPQGHGRRSAAQPGEIGDGRIAAVADVSQRGLARAHCRALLGSFELLRFQPPRSVGQRTHAHGNGRACTSERGHRRAAWQAKVRIAGAGKLAVILHCVWRDAADLRFGKAVVSLR